MERVAVGNSEGATMAQFWKTIFTSVLSAAAVSGAVIWLVHTTANKYIGFVTDKQLETVKTELSEELESFKGKELTNQLRFNKLLDFRREQLSEFYWPIYIRLQIDNAVYDDVFGGKDASVPKDVGKPLEQFLLDNHKELLKIIQDKFYLAELNPDLEKDLLHYVRHAAVYLAMRTTPRYDNDVPATLNEPYPKDLFQHFESQLKALQSDYNEMLKQTRPQRP
jgi:hypothetical protein